ncbi:MAG: hypothetical protein M1129_06940 [Candidatus Thermoplasmatota archaeon]|jgi:DNA replication factor GINS|nr:hypothetical protein [Candidatus Thermoplasmatota archaeon]MCL5954806.1 hypothetical protein [Candidatus Thermoplasmatota archaeon]
MTLDPTQIDKVASDLRSFFRAEFRSKKIKKLDPAFYKNVTSALDSLNEEAEKSLKAQDITSYMDLKKRVSDLEKDFKALFQRRFEKIATLSIYPLDSELMNTLTPEEKEFIVRLHNMMQDQQNLLINKLPAPQEPKEEAQVKPEKPLAPAKEPESEEEEEPALEEPLEQKGSEYALVRIFGDQPPIAQPDRDYYLHDNDLVYLPEPFADILINRKAAQRVSLPDIS